MRTSSTANTASETEVKAANKSASKKKAVVAPDHQSLRLWLRLLACHNLAESQLRGQLRHQFGTTLARFDLMAQLRRHPAGLKMGELSKLLMVTGGNVTGLVDRLIKEGLIERRDDPGDRRAYHVYLTKKGKAFFDQIAVMHEQWVISMFEGLSKRDQARLSDLLGKFRDHLNNFPLS
jgi:DNA-binding MarR family transcriptional regulator